MVELVTGRLTSPINKTSDQVTKFVNKSISKTIDYSYVDGERISDAEFAKVKLVEKVEKFKFDFEIEAPELSEAAETGKVADPAITNADGEGKEDSSAEATAADSGVDAAAAAAKEAADEVSKFNESLTQRTRDFVLLGAFKKAMQAYIKEYVITIRKHAEDNKDVAMHDAESSEESKASQKLTLPLINKLCILFDFQIYLIKELPSTKTNFYQCLAFATDLLYSISTDVIDQFWSYLEARRVDIQTYIFDPASTGDRIAILEICNSLTDKFQSKLSPQQRARTDTYKKDTFNDTFQARVRVFLTNVLALEDNTGLNKYFSVSNIIGQDILTSIGSSGRDDILIRDIIQINKLFRDPYAYVRPANHKQLQVLANTMSKVFNYLMEEEQKWSRKNPAKDQYLIPPESNSASAVGSTSDEHLYAKYNNKLYFPEVYSLAAFDDVKRGEKYDRLKKEDSSFAAKQFDSQKVRRTVLVQIYIICTLFYELAPSNKRAFFQNLGGPSTLKHFVDDSVPESAVSIFYRIKRELPKRYRTIDTPFSHFLTHLSITELFWWQWLIYGKGKDGKPLFADRNLNKEELESVDDKFNNLLPLKEKRYFNVYATPQLSRKMKVGTGLEKLEKSRTGREYDDVEVQRLQENLEDAKRNLNEKDEDLVQAHNIAYWKLLKKQRTKQWLNFGELATKSGIAGEEAAVVEDAMEIEKDEAEAEEKKAGDDIIEESKDTEINDAADVEAAKVEEDVVEPPVSRKRARDDEDDEDSNEAGETKKLKV